ncbi:endonuclease 8-like 1 [Cuculus canorus]|uniref:endonuclease 8-like 1 n=1 Tax=Cuculus canorus TaxID=55661 RepID=UPI0023AB4AFC|nr:endonuclease 8-like 1 [Cuculus canorus]
MPECPELHLAGRYINARCSELLFSGSVSRSAVARGPAVPFSSEAFAVRAVARGKELRLTLAPNGLNDDDALHLVFRFGMTGSFRLCPAASTPRHAHLVLRTREVPPRALCFVDPRRFGSWRLGPQWQPGRGPCVITEYRDFRENVLKNLDDKAFDKPICEALLNQKFFNGIGNYLRAEILYRLKIPPFEKARTVLEALKDQEQAQRTKNASLTLSKKLKLKRDNLDLLELCHTVPMEVIAMEKNFLEPDHLDNYAAFKNWLQCYMVPGMNSLRDHNGRTIWFQGEPGSMAPKGQTSRKKRTQTKADPKADPEVLKAGPEALTPKVTTRASKRRSRAAAKPPTPVIEEEAEGPRKGRARGRRKVTAAPASSETEVPVNVKRTRRTTARRGEVGSPCGFQTQCKGCGSASLCQGDAKGQERSQ